MPVTGDPDHPHVPIIRVVSMGRRNTTTKSQVQEFKWLRVIREHSSGSVGCCIDRLSRPRLTGLGRFTAFIALVPSAFELSTLICTWCFFKRKDRERAGQLT
jgi:hypothetical protein